jgi:hypothetical protein
MQRHPEGDAHRLQVGRSIAVRVSRFPRVAHPSHPTSRPVELNYEERGICAPGKSAALKIR